MAKKTSRKAAARRPAARRPAAKAAKRKPAKAKTKSPRAAVPAHPSPRQVFLDALDREHKTTLKLMRAFPADQGAFKPHERSSSAKRLMWTFAVEQKILLNALRGTLKMPPNFPPEPETVEEAIVDFE